MSKVSIKVNSKELSKVFQLIQVEELVLGRALGEIALAIKSSIDENFNVGGRYGDGELGGGNQRWLPYKTYTKKLTKRVRKAGGKTLVDTGNLRDSIQVFAAVKSVVMSSARIDAPTHHYGDERPIFGGPMIGIFPRRPIFVIQDDDILEIEEIIVRHVETILGIR